MRVAGIPLGVLKRTVQSLQSWINCPFNTANGLNDLSGNSRTFTQVSGGLTVTTTNDASGALRLNGSGWMTTVDTFNLQGNDFNISCDIFIENSSDYYSVFLAQRVNSAAADIEFLSINNGQLYVAVYFADNSSTAFLGSAVRNQWQTIELKRVANVFTLTVDGISTSQTISKSVRSSSNGVLNIGNANQTDTSGTCTGSMRNLNIQVAD